MSVPLLNAAGRRRSPVTLPGYLAGRPPRNKGLVAVGTGLRFRGLGPPPAQIPACTASALGSWLGFARRTAGRAKDA
jgi:hypothetical protein